MTLEIQHDRSLASLNALGLNVKAQHFANACSEADVCEALAFAREKVVPVTVLGGGSNVVFRGNVGGLVLHVAIPGILFEEEAVEAGSGEDWHQLVQSSLEQGLSGIENLSLIPGSAGAAPIQNIGAYGAEVAEVFDSLIAIDRETLETVALSRADCRFGYRDSIFKGALKDRLVITRIRLKLNRVFVPNLGYDALRREMESTGAPLTPQSISEAVCAIRRRKLPNPDVIGNVGSFFKNPVVTHECLVDIEREYPDVPHWHAAGAIKVSAGWLIEQCGLKGRSVGGAAVSEQHALVLVNRDDASGEEILSLAEEIRQQVRTRFGISLEIEPRIY